ncbi:MAG: PTS sugar transporter subunit IIA [Deltaproteobacteria bacterium]|nr:PTS sugar transporter subunit IIA [Deltaproteobacteria bacterium]MDD9826924.1 PTS sugar transporter subunit IIA [Deltaproteobacteria bacterium]MDD9853581.1 PTS sugar transporter subunit IIA [Deltaproteobacteria bacterium]MDD9872728.1 PTS sugar transporter subunit IIA [Deltaproteobacteria bacterium]
MKIVDILVREAVVLDLESRDKRGALGELCAALAAAEPGLESAPLLEVLQAREALQSTGIGEGVAIPHGKLPGLPRLLASFARSRAGVDFESIDGAPTHLFFLLVVPEHAGGAHLKALARISRFFRDEAFRKALLEAGSRAEIVAAIEQEDARF